MWERVFDVINLAIDCVDKEGITDNKAKFEGKSNLKSMYSLLVIAPTSSDSTGATDDPTEMGLKLSS